MFAYETKFEHFSTNEIKPAGWLKRQLRIQAEGLSGHLDEVWPDIRDSAWIGGSREGWERVPYWLDGFIPLAYLLDDESLKRKAQRYIDAILTSQEEDGWICPCSKAARAGYDTWAVILICKALMVYGECTHDPRAAEAVYKALFNLSIHIRQHTLHDWGQYRWFEALLPLHWIAQKKSEDWMERLAVTLCTQGIDYQMLFANWHDQQPEKVWSLQTHIVNLMMALKSRALISGITKEDPHHFAAMMWETLSRYHGSAVGHILGDECLAGQSPIHGAELCSIVEAMYSCEVLSEITGNTSWMDRTEMLAFNGLATTVSEDMWSHQYLQIENQIACVRQETPPVYYTNSEESNRFGLEPHFGCCTANFSQGWPKLALASWYRCADGVLSALLVPSELRLEIEKIPVVVRLETDYPFRGDLHYTIDCAAPVSFALLIRIPGFAQSAEVEGNPAQPGALYKMKKLWRSGEQIHVRLRFETKMLERPNQLFAVQRGPLFFSLPIASEASRLEYIKDGVERKAPYCDYEYRPVSEWRYGFAGDRFRVIENPVPEIPFSRTAPALQLEAEMARVPWELLKGQTNVCAPFPGERKALSTELKRLQPYGTTVLRMTVMPLLSRPE